MVDLHTVCCMCGDVGFPDKLFRCTKCQNRFQHSYCSNYYSESSQSIQLCDWCKSEGKNSKNSKLCKKSSTAEDTGVSSRSEYSGDKVKQHDDRPENMEKGKSSAISSRTTTRRYKLLKDVMK